MTVIMMLVMVMIIMISLIMKNDMIAIVMMMMMKEKKIMMIIVIVFKGAVLDFDNLLTVLQTVSNITHPCGNEAIHESRTMQYSHEL